MTTTTLEGRNHTINKSIILMLSLELIIIARWNSRPVTLCDSEIFSRPEYRQQVLNLNKSKSRYTFRYLSLVFAQMKCPELRGGGRFEELTVSAFLRTSTPIECFTGTRRSVGNGKIRNDREGNKSSQKPTHM